MAVGASYPADLIDGNGQVSKGNVITFLDSTNQPQQGNNPLPHDGCRVEVLVICDG